MVPISGPSHQRKRRQGYLTSATKAPNEEDPNHPTWESDDSLVMALACFVNSTESKIGWVYLYYKTTKDIWDMPKNMYYVLENSTQVFEIKSSLEGTQNKVIFR